MKTTTIAICLGGALVLGACATKPSRLLDNDPTNDSGTPVAAVVGKTADPDREVCRREAVTGSRFTKKICHTQAEWDRMRARAQSGTRDIQRLGGTTGTKPAGSN